MLHSTPGSDLSPSRQAFVPSERAQTVHTDDFVAGLRAIVGRHHVLITASTRRFRTGYRFGGGRVLAVIRPGNLVEQWLVLQACVRADKIVIMQAANTGLTGGSTPDGDQYDRDVVLINAMRIKVVHLIDGGRQVLCLPGATLDHLEKVLKPPLRLLGFRAEPVSRLSARPAHDRQSVPLLESRPASWLRPSAPNATSPSRSPPSGLNSSARSCEGSHDVPAATQSL